MHEESIEFQSFGLRNNVAQFCVLKVLFLQICILGSWIWIL